MKTRFSTLDICAVLAEINEKAVGMRLVNVYDIDSKTYLFKLAKPDLKMMLLVESGIRIHLSEFDWPKNLMPSGFAMKMRKHLRGRRLVSATQLGIDRIIDLQFGSDVAAFHVFVELYDRGNIALTDYEDVILNLLRFRKDLSSKPDQGFKEENEDVRFAVHEPYPRHAARPTESFISIEKLKAIFKDAKEGALVKRVLNPNLPYGAPCIEHSLSVAGFSGNAKVGKEFVVETDIEKLHTALLESEELMKRAKAGKSKGFIIKKVEKKSDGELLTNVEFHPFLFDQHKAQPHQEYPTFNQAVDEFFSSLESQKSDLKVLQRERTALRKLENIRKDHESRLEGLRSEQDDDKRKAWIIESNLELVDQAIKVICSAVANQVDWSDINVLVTDAQGKGDPVAKAIKSLKLERNMMVMWLSEPFLDDDDDDFDFMGSSDDESVTSSKKAKEKPVKVDIDLALSAYANAQRYYNKKRQAAQKERRTMDASTKAFKSAEKKTKQTLKEAATVQTIQKARKVYWFEKFLWFISSENYLVLGGRDAQQNELLVKKYLAAGDVYVHADLHGATSCIIKNSSGSPVPPKTLNEAGTMAICHSAAWDAKVITSAYWVRHDQVSKTAPTGEYLTTGSFLIRGKKNYLPPSYLVYGFGFLFKVDETCVWKHKGERKVRATEDDLSTIVTNDASQMEELDITSDHDLDSENETNSVSSGIKSDKLSPFGGAMEVEKKDHEECTDESEQNFAVKDADESTDCQISSGDPIEGVCVAQEGDNIAQENDNVTQERVNVMQESDNITQEGDTAESVKNALTADFPDTVVRLQYETNDKYNLSSIDTPQDDGVVYLGDDNPVSRKNEKVDQRKVKPRMSAKQRREQKKVQMQCQEIDEDTEEVVEKEPRAEDPKKNSKPQIPSQPVIKRGQKKKLRKMKDKYKDQDEDDRKMMMEILQSANPPKQKEKKGKSKHQEHVKKPQPKDKPKPQQQQQQQQSSEHPQPRQTAKEKADRNEDSDEERETMLKEEHLNIKEVEDVLDSLTGLPALDDVMLFAIPICAPYNTMQNYKFKVKLTPGTGKKGKAAKTAIGMFQASRDTTAQEKDHLRSVKDHDLSRNMPGKVKVSAPNLQKQKFKGRRR